MSGSRFILLLDPHHKDRDYYADRLRRASSDYVVIQATTGRTGLAICEAQGIDCVVLELELPDMSGFEVLFKLVPRPRHPEIPVVVHTRLWNPYILEAARRNGAQAALHKDMASGDLLDTTILKALSAIPQTHKESHISAARPTAESALPTSPQRL